MRRAALCGVLLACAVQAAEPAPPGELLPSGPLAARVGEWVTYRLDGGGGRASYWRIAVVGEARDKWGRDAVWIEMELGLQAELVAPLAQWRMLAARGHGLGPDGVTRLQVAQGFERPREVSADALPRLFATAPVDPTPPNPTLAGRLRVRTGAPSRLMTAAGTLSARPIELVFEGHVLRRLWTSREVPVLGLARMELPGLGQTMEVVAHGLDAKPRMAPPAPEAPQIQLER